MVTYLGGSILITIFALGGSIVSYNLQPVPVKRIWLLLLVQRQ
jgi:hypothetical protein